MKNKSKYQIITLFLLLVSNITVFSQDKIALEKETQKMYEASIELKYDEILEYTYPKLFDLVPKEQMTDVLEQTFENEIFTMAFLPIPPNFEYGNIKTIEEKKLCVIKYNLGITMTYNEEIDDETIEFMLAALKSMPNYTDVNFDLDKNAFIIKGNSTMISVSDELTKNQWKFITYDSKKRIMVADYLLSDDILTKLGL